MRKKKISSPLRLLATLMIALALLILLAVLLSHMIYGRSLQASIYEVMLRKRYATDRTAEEEVRRLQRRRAKGESPYELPEDLTLQSDIEEYEHDDLQVFVLNGESDGGIDVIYLHGGAYINSFNAYQWRFVDRLARRANCRVIAPAYHLAPFADYRRAYEDLIKLYRALCDPGRRLILMGDSAGGGLALGFAEALLISGDPQPERLILISPWVDVSMTNPAIQDYEGVDPILHLPLVRVHGQCWAGEADTTYWPVSPLYGDMAGLPPVTLYCGTREMLCPDILSLDERLRAAGVDVDLHLGRGLNHDYPLMPIPEGRRAAEEIAGAVAG